jgi:hypothetical protein
LKTTLPMMALEEPVAGICFRGEDAFAPMAKFTFPKADQLASLLPDEEGNVWYFEDNDLHVNGGAFSISWFRRACRTRA